MTSTARLPMGNMEFLMQWLQPQGRRAVVLGALIAFLIVGVALLVWYTGGIKYVYAHSMYLPILLAALFFGWRGGLLAALAGGLALGPWMPIDTTTGEMQETINWLYRLGFFLLI
ncbi:MAG: GGDEF domain-containing protein, partial [Gammaproteobacteria bacterium]